MQLAGHMSGIQYLPLLADIAVFFICHDVAGLHPWDILHVAGAQLGKAVKGTTCRATPRLSRSTRSIHCSEVTM